LFAEHINPPKGNALFQNGKKSVTWIKKWIIKKSCVSYVRDEGNIDKTMCPCYDSAVVGMGRDIEIWLDIERV